MSDDIPEAWAALLTRKGIKASYRGLSERADVSHETARHLIRGRSVKASTVQKVADALGVDREVIHELRGDAVVPNVWEPPRASSLLSDAERDALSRLISVMTAGREANDGAPIGTPPRRTRSTFRVAGAAEARSPEGSPQPPPQGRTDRSRDG